MVQLCHIHHAIAICLLWGVSSLKVQQPPNVQSETAETHQQPALDGLSPKNLGSKAISGQSKQSPSVSQSYFWRGFGTVSSPVPPSHNNYLAFSASERMSGSNTLLFTTVILWVIVMIFFVVSFGGTEESKSSEQLLEEDGWESPHPASHRGMVPVERKTDPADGRDYSLEELRSKYEGVYEEQAFFEYFHHTCLQQGRSESTVSTRIPTARSDSPTFTFSPENLVCNSSESQDQDNEGLKLCLKCEILSAQDYANNRVSQEHIDECLWIAKIMLRQMPLESWVDLSQNDRESFESRVGALLQAAPMPASFSGNVTPELLSRLPLSQGSLQRDFDLEISLGSDVSFKTAPTKQQASADGSNPLPHKSPVPVMNCGDAASVDELASSAASTQMDLGESVFASVFNSTTSSPQESQASSPMDCAKMPPSGCTIPSTGYSTSPNSPYAPYEKLPAHPLSPREIALAPHGIEALDSGGVQRNADSPLGVLSASLRKSHSAHSGGGSSSSSRSRMRQQVFSETPDLTQQQRFPELGKPSLVSKFV